MNSDPINPDTNKSERGYAPNELQEGTWVTVLFRQIKMTYGSVTMGNIVRFYTDNDRELTEANAEFLEDALSNSQYAEDELSL
jgi:hypothetical protein